MEKIEIIKPDDWHVHFRDNEILKAVVPETTRHFSRAIVMPNLTPPILTGNDAIKYKKRIENEIPKEDEFLPLMTLYLTENTNKDKIKKLIALSESANPHEANSALSKGITLMQKYQLSQTDINKTDLLTVTQDHYQHNMSGQDGALISWIAATHGVFMFKVPANRNTGKRAQVILTGLKGDIESTQYFIEIVARQINAQVSHWRRLNDASVANGNDYKWGLVMGFVKRFKEEMKVISSEVGSGMVAVDTRFSEAEQFARVSFKLQSGKTSARSNDHRANGTQDSDKISSARGVHGALSALRLEKF